VRFTLGFGPAVLDYDLGIAAVKKLCVLIVVSIFGSAFFCVLELFFAGIYSTRLGLRALLETQKNLVAWGGRSVGVCCR